MFFDLHKTSLLSKRVRGLVSSANHGCIFLYNEINTASNTAAVITPARSIPLVTTEDGREKILVEHPHQLVLIKHCMNVKLLTHQDKCLSC